MPPFVEPWEEIEGSITTPHGFRAAALCAPIKPKSTKKDLALLVSDLPALGAALFTQNRVVAAPVLVSRKHLAVGRGRLRAIIVNSGNANACTGPRGRRDAENMTKHASRALGLDPNEVLVASTGVIGNPLPMERIKRAIPPLIDGLAVQAGQDFSDAILTTDTRRKVSVVRLAHKKNSITIAGTAKGAGMIHPRLATLLAFVTTDASLSRTLLERSLREAVAASFNRLTVDGDTSTNDSIFLIANGGAPSAAIARPGAAFNRFCEGLIQVCTSLAKQIARDGEGAQKLIEVAVNGARSVREADQVARAIANSPLVKTAMAGADANWGRILCAAGYSGASIQPQRVDIQLNKLPVCRSGRPTGFDEVRAKKLLHADEIVIEVNLNRGRQAATIWTCDLTEEYIRINASYRS